MSKIHVSKKKYYNETMYVHDKDELNHAAELGYGKIIPSGELAKEMREEYEKEKKKNTASNIALAVGLFVAWPVLIVGVLGKAFSNDLKKYKLYEEDGEIVFIINKNLVNNS